MWATKLSIAMLSIEMPGKRNDCGEPAKTRRMQRAGIVNRRRSIRHDMLSCFSIDGECYLFIPDDSPRECNLPHSSSSILSVMLV